MSLTLDLALIYAHPVTSMFFAVVFLAILMVAVAFIRGDL